MGGGFVWAGTRKRIALNSSAKIPVTSFYGEGGTCALRYSALSPKLLKLSK